MNKRADNNGEALAQNARNRIHKKNKNALQVFVGETGIGKSYSTATFNGMVDPSFFDDIERVVFKPKDFMHQVRTMHHGESIMYDESGVTLAARDFQKKIVKMVGYVNQTFRSRNLCVSYTVPSMAFIEKQVRMLLHTIIEMKRIDYDHEIAFGECHKVNHNALDGRTTLGKYEFQTWGGGRHIIHNVGFGLPPKKWITEYEKVKFEFCEEIYDEFESEMDGSALTRTEIEVLRKQSHAFLNCLPEVKKYHSWEDIESWCRGPNKRTLQRWIAKPVTPRAVA